MAASERSDSTSDLKLAAKVFLYLAFSEVVVYLLVFVLLVFVPGFGNQLRSMGVDEAVLTKVFYPLLYFIR